MITLQNTYVKHIVYATVSSLTEARAFCDQRLLISSKSRQEFNSDLDAGIIEVYSDMYASNYYGPGF